MSFLGIKLHVQGDDKIIDPHQSYDILIQTDTITDMVPLKSHIITKPSLQHVRKYFI